MAESFLSTWDRIQLDLEFSAEFWDIANRPRREVGIGNVTPFEELLICYSNSFLSFSRKAGDVVICNV